MGFRFRKSFKIAPGIRVNLNAKSTSIRIGPKGLGYTISSNGTKRVSASIPGTGISYSEVTSSKRTSPPVQPQSRLDSTPKKSGRVGIAVVAVIGLIVAVNMMSSSGTSRSTPPPASTTAANAAFPHQQQQPSKTTPSLEAPEANAPPAQQIGSISPRAPAPPPDIPSAKPPQIRFVTATSLNVRSAPDPSGEILGKIPNGHQIAVIDETNGWLLVQSAAAGRGWVSGQYTSATRPTPVAVPAPQALVSATPPSINRDAIIQKIIERSIRNYSGSCPCPYNTMRSGRRCGGNSAYSKPGGRSPICYPSDVTEAMIAAFR